MKRTKSCLNCSSFFEYQQSNKIYCSQKCKRRAFYLKNIEIEKQRSKQWVDNNKEYTKLRRKKYRQSEFGKKVIKTYLEKNKGKVKANKANYRASKIKALLPNTDLKQIKFIYKNCPKDKQVDHIYPLNSDWVCGLHVPSNLCYLSASENASKGNRKLKKYHKESFYD